MTMLLTVLATISSTRMARIRFGMRKTRKSCGRSLSTIVSRVCCLQLFSGLWACADSPATDRLFSYYNPALHGLVKNVLALFSKPRETPLADNLVLSATSKSDPLAFTLLHRMQDKTYDLEQLDMAAECTDHMAAGIDTTGGEGHSSQPIRLVSPVEVLAN